jgi:CelD/BcsL family acetyltransferase involved in cellulose biosynthesis
MTEEEGARPVLAGRDVNGVQAFDEYAHLHALKWPEGVSSFLRPASIHLHRRLAELWIPKGLMLLPCLELHGKLIAGIYGLACGKDLLQYQLGWDPAYARLGLGNLAMRWSIDSAMRAGFERYDLLPGQHEYKHSWSQQARYVTDLECFHHQKPRAMLFHLLRSLKRRVSAPMKAHA